jgi:citrate/tricarballylate utilization protein
MSATETLPESSAVGDARRAMEVCNACRYCEGYCAVFPAMELKRDFAAADLGYLSNLCHGCRGCFYACQYAPPHEFGINLPKTFAEVRAETYEHYAWPGPLARLFRRNGVVVSVAVALGVALVLVLVGAMRSPELVFGTHVGPGAFYVVIPFEAMVSVASITFVFAILAIGIATARFWRDTSTSRVTPRAAWEALRDGLTLKNLGGGGHGCNDADGSFSGTRRWLHHTMFYGFMLCFASTTTATIYAHEFGWIAPYALTSLPVLLGTVGGIGMVVGTIGLLWLKVTGDTEPVARRLLGADYALLAMLLLVAVTGLVLLGLRSTGAMGVALAVHLGCILALFVIAPYSRFVHGSYRLAALLRAAIDRRASPSA